MSVYFIREGDSGPIKIGVALDVSMRLKELQVGNPRKLVLMTLIQGVASDEGRLHRQFGHLRIRGEWFEPGPDLLAFIAQQPEPRWVSCLGSKRMIAVAQPAIQKRDPPREGPRHRSLPLCVNDECSVELPEHWHSFHCASCLEAWEDGAFMADTPEIWEAASHA